MKFIILQFSPRSVLQSNNIAYIILPK